MEALWKHLHLTDEVAKQVGVDPDLVSSLGLETLQRCYVTYDEDRGSFEGYARRCLRSAYRSFLKSEQHSQLSCDPTEKLFRQSTRLDARLLGAIKAALTDEEYELLVERYVKDRSDLQIGYDHGVIRQTVWARLKRIKAKINGSIEVRSILQRSTEQEDL